MDINSTSSNEILDNEKDNCILDNSKQRLSITSYLKMHLSKYTKKQKKIKNDRLSTYVKESLIWTKLETSGTLPSERSGSSGKLVNNLMFFFGGCEKINDDDISCTNDLYSFDMDKHIWYKYECKTDNPSIRASFAMCATDNNSLIISGGTDSSNNMCNDMYEFNIRNNIWTKINNHCINFYYGHTINNYKSVFLIFGGSKGLVYSNELYQYDIYSNTYMNLITTGNKPSPRYKHETVLTNDKLYVFGGGNYKPNTGYIEIYCLNLITLVWEKINVHGQIPVARVAFASAYDEYDNNIYISGGFNDELKRLNDLYYFNIRTHVWTKAVILRQKCPKERAFHNATFYKGGFYIFKGADGNNRYNDVWKYNMRINIPSLANLCIRKIKNENIEGDWHQLPMELIDEILHSNKYSTKIN